MKKLALPLAASLAVFSSPAQSAVVLTAEVNGLGTFLDTNTGLQWLRLDNFFNQTAAEMIGIANAAGFQLADQAALDTLLSSLNDPGANFDFYAAAIGRAPNRDLFWGAYGPVENREVNWAYAFRGQGTWSFNTNADINVVYNFNSPDADLNLWAFRARQVSGAVPEPATWAMMLLGFFGIGGIMRKRAGGSRPALA